MIAERTLELRRKLGYSLMSVVAPKFTLELKQAHRQYLDRGLPRPFTQMLKKEYGKKSLIGCEIGFGLGENAENLLRELNIEKLYCVDPYFGSQPYLDTGVMVDWFTQPTQKDKERIKQLRSDSRIELVMQTSDDTFKKQFIPKDLAFIYIDGCHSYENCYRDIENSMEYVRTGGYVGGHDFANGSLIGVARAVFDYATLTEQTPNMVFPDFWFKKGSD